MTAAPHATASTTAIEAWFSHLCFAELVVEVRHRAGSTLHGVVVRRVAACTFTLGDGARGDSWSGDHRAQSKNHRDCAGEHQSSRWDLNGCHNHTLSSFSTASARCENPGFKGVRTPSRLSRQISKRSQPVGSLDDWCQFTGRPAVSLFPCGTPHPRAELLKRSSPGRCHQRHEAAAPCQPTCCVRTMLASIS